MAGQRKGCNADAKADMTLPREVDHGKGKEVPFPAENKQVDTIIETVQSQVSSNKNIAEKSLNDELLANDSLGG